MTRCTDYRITAVEMNIVCVYVLNLLCELEYRLLLSVFTNPLMLTSLVLDVLQYFKIIDKR